MDAPSVSDAEFKSDGVNQTTIINRHGQHEPVDIQKIQQRIQYLINHPTPLTHVDPVVIIQRVVSGLADGMTTSELDEMVKTCAF